MMHDYQQFYQHFEQSFGILHKAALLTYQYNQRTQVYSKDKIKLYHYQAKQAHPHKIPVLIVFSTVNRPEILDLFPEQSFIAGLLDNGMDVYLVDWGYPDSKDQSLGMSAYLEYLSDCVRFIKQKHDQLNLLGVCQGGLLSLCYACMQKEISKLVLISTPVDFATKQDSIAALLKDVPIEEVIAKIGNVPGSWLTQFFLLQRPVELIGKKYLQFMGNLHDEAKTEKFLFVEKWLHDTPDQTAQAYTELVKHFYQANQLVRDTLALDGKKISLQQINVPILNIIARDDHIVPPAASRALKKYINPDQYSQRVFSAGHIGLYLSDRVRKRVPTCIAQWLQK